MRWPVYIREALRRCTKIDHSPAELFRLHVETKPTRFALETFSNYLRPLNVRSKSRSDNGLMKSLIALQDHKESQLRLVYLIVAFLLKTPLVVLSSLFFFNSYIIVQILTLQLNKI